MKRASVSRIWIVSGLLFFVALLCISVSQVLASTSQPAASGSVAGAASVNLEANPFDTFGQVGPAAPPYTIYFPTILLNRFEAFTYQDNFESTGSGWTWRSGIFDAGYRTDGDHSTVWHYRMTTQDDIGFTTGPTYVGGNFDYTAYMRRATFEQPLYYGDEYGLVLSPHRIDLYNPYVEGAYTFQIRFQIGSSVNSSWEVYTWTQPYDNASSRSLLITHEEPPTSAGGRITDVAKKWNIFQIARTGNQLRFSLTHEDGGPLEQVFDCVDPNLPYIMYIGFYAAHSRTDFGDYPVEVQFDNVVANSVPW